MLCILAALALAAPAIAQNDGEPVLAPENPAFVEYLNSGALLMERGPGTFMPGLVPEPIDLSHLEGRWGVSSAVSATPPAFYDLRPLGKLTPMRNQGSCGSCWAFASIGSLESSLMPTEAWDFSENNLKNRHGFDISCCSGGNRTMSTAYLTRWEGPVAEKDDPYNPSSCSSPLVAPAKHVQEVIYIPNRTSSLGNDAIKQAVMTYGAVYTSYYHNNSYYKSSTGAYYYSGSASSNHAVCIVGWDDSFSRANFLTAPPGDGAFLIRNSWGTSWGTGGYFWMSYHDSRLARTENAVFRAEPNTNYTTVYQHDPLGWVSSTGYGSNTAWFANVFTAQANSSLMAAAWYSASPNSTYEVYIYTNPTSGPINSAGPVASKSGTIETAGYHTITLNSPVPITAGQKFSVVVKHNTPGYGYPIPLERPYSGYASKATAGPGQSYISSTGASWSDITSSYANTNVCLKAFASTSSSPPTPGSLSVTPSTSFASTGQTGGPFSPSSQAYTLTNTGGSSINWTAAKGQSWVSLSTTSGALAAGASATLTVSINSNANTLAAGTYTDTVTFANATNGAGNTSRSVTLTVSSKPEPGPGSLSVSPSTGLASAGQVGGPFSPASQAYTLTNPGESSVNWTASKSQGWVSLSATGGTLAPGANATVSVMINSSAGSLAAGSYNDTVAFTNTTNGAGNTSRSVSLTVVTAPIPGGYQVVPAAFNWIDPSGHKTISMRDNSSSYAQYMPFAFQFYGKSYSSLYVSSNGLLGFVNSGLYLYTNQNIPTTTLPNTAIYPYWDDLDPAKGGSVRIASVDAAPNRKVVVSWVDVPHHMNTTARFTFQAILEEGTNDIVFQYLEVSPAHSIYGGGRSATIGIENQTGKEACKHSYNTAGAVSNGTALRITTSPVYAQGIRGR